MERVGAVSWGAWCALAHRDQPQPGQVAGTIVATHTLQQGLGFGSALVGEQCHTQAEAGVVGLRRGAFVDAQSLRHM